MLFTLTGQPIDAKALAATMADAGAGAYVSFEGWVRDVHEGEAVTSLEYDVFAELAVSEGTRILQDAIKTFGLTGARAVHRSGSLGVGECAVWVGVTARHRAAAFDACRHIMDTIKENLPIWKKEYVPGKDAHWVNCRPALAPKVTPDTLYDRQMRLPEIGKHGQLKLSQARVLVVGLGGLGCAAATALAAAGIGTLGLAEHDTLSADNLHRQTLYSANDIGRPKLELAAARLAALNPLAGIVRHPGKVTGDNAAALFGAYDIVLDCTDNFTAKYLLSDTAMHTGTPLVQASIYRFEGQLMTIDPADDAGCLRCIFPQPPSPGTVGDCAQTGVLGTVPIVFGTLQANEAIKRILGMETQKTLTLFDLRSLASRSIVRGKSAACPACAGHAAAPQPSLEITPQSVEGYTLVDVREADELIAQPLQGAVHVPMSRFDVTRIPSGGRILVVCAHGVRSLVATEYLRANGFDEVYSLAGGIENMPPERLEA